MSRRSWIPLVAAAVALVAGALAVLFRPSPEPDEPVAVVERDSTPSAPVDPTVRRPEQGVHGGVYEGRVVDAKDQPVAGAEVLLVAIGRPEKVLVEAGGLAEPIAVDYLEPHRTAARTKTDAHGRFRAGAGDATVLAIMSHHPQHSPGILTADGGHALLPASDLVVRLPAPGRLDGLVIDAETKAPVAGARVTINVQQVANREAPGPARFTATNAFAKFLRYVEREFAPLVWGIAPVEGQEGMNVHTSRDGRFQFGPVSDEVQIEVVITHPEYKWESFDPEVRFPGEGGSRLRRLSIPPGQTVEKTFELHRGNEISGIVVDEADRPIPDVRVSLEHIVQTAQHHWYRTKDRRAATDSAGRFRVAGLDRGPYQVTFEHDAFGRRPVPDAVPEGTKDKRFQMPSAGWIIARVSGGPDDQSSFGAEIHLEPVDVPSRDRARQARLIVRDGQVKVDRVAPGRWRVWLTFAGRVTRPQEVDVRPTEPTEIELALTQGGRLRARLVDSSGRAADPASVTLFPLDVGVGGGDLLGRAGEVSADGILPGRYRAVVRGMGFVEAAVEPFEVAEGGTADLGTIRMRRKANLKILSVTDERNRVPTSEVTVTVQMGDKPPERQVLRGTMLIPVEPGTVVVRATTQDGKAFQQSYDVKEGDTVDVKIVLETP